MDDEAAMGGGGKEADGGGRVFVGICGVCAGVRGVLFGEGDVEEAVEDG